MQRPFAAALSALLIFTSYATADPVDDARAETEAHLARADDGTPLCFPPITGPVEVHAVRASGRGEPATAHKTSPFRFADLRVEATAQPALIVLKSNGPTIWRIDAAPESRIAAIVIAGSREALISGLPEGIPVTQGNFHTRLGEKVGCGKPPSRETLAAEANEWHEILTRSRKVRDLFREARCQQRGLQRAIRVIEDATPQSAALRLLRAEHAQIQEELAALMAEQSEIQATMKKVGKPRPREVRINEEKHAAGLLGSNLLGLEKGLAYFGKFVIASYQERSRTGRFVISDAATHAFAELKHGGQRDLASLSEPKFPVLPLGAPLLEVPADLIGDDAVDYMLERGYIMADVEQAAGFICQRFDAAYRSLGMHLPRCGYGKYGRAEYVVLGPLALNQLQCMGLRSLYLPSSVSEPQGEDCSDVIIRLNADLCTPDKAPCPQSSDLYLRY